MVNRKNHPAGLLHTSLQHSNKNMCGPQGGRLCLSIVQDVSLLHLRYLLGDARP